MALLDFLKNKKEADRAKESKKSAKKAVKKPVKKADDVSVKPEPASAKASARREGFSYDIVKEPHISEKATALYEKDQYTFKVAKTANKIEVKKAVEGIYGVDVLSVNMIKIPDKKRRLGRTQGWKSGHTKAVVTIKQGQKIEIL